VAGQFDADGLALEDSPIVRTNLVRCDGFNRPWEELI